MRYKTEELDLFVVQNGTIEKVAPHSCKASIDGCHIIDNKNADTAVSCFDCDNEEDINDLTGDPRDTHSPLMSPFSSIEEPICNSEKFNGILYNGKTSTESTSLLSSEDDGYFCSNYDADDEEVTIHGDTKETNNNIIRKNYVDKSIDNDDGGDDDFFCFRVKSDQTIYNLESALDVIRERPKLTDRLFCQEDSDDCFRESEYDVIDTDNDIDVVEVIDDTNNMSLSRIEIKVRAHTLTEEGRLIEVKTTPIRDKNKLKIGKVKSIPNIRFPIRKSRSKFYRSISEISLVSSKNHTQDTVFDEYISQNQNPHITILKPGVFESDGQHGLTSDADYLTTINKCYSADSQVETNIDTQAEDIPPTKFLSVSKIKKKRRPISSLDFSNPSLKKSTLIGRDTLQGRFQVTTVAEVATPELESHSELPNGEIGKQNLSNKTICFAKDHDNLPNGSLNCNEDFILNSYEIL